MGVRLTWVQQAAGAIRRWRIQFRIRGSRRESAVAAFYVGDLLLREVGSIASYEFMNPDIIHALEIAAIVVAGTLTGSELAVAVFFHPRISRLEDAVHVQAAQTLAKALGMVMPFWYALTFLLALLVTFVAHTTRSTPWWLALASTALFALISVYSVLLPVPINNQVASWKPASVPENWRDLRRRWDLLHAIRVAFLIVALIALVASCVINSGA